MLPTEHTNHPETHQSAFRVFSVFRGQKLSDLFVTFVYFVGPT